MTDLLADHHGREPLRDTEDRPYIDLGADQIRRIAEIITGRSENTVRLEYGGANYWFVRPLGPDGQPSDDEIVWPIEPRHQ